MRKTSGDLNPRISISLDSQIRSIVAARTRDSQSTGVTFIPTAAFTRTGFMRPVPVSRPQTAWDAGLVHVIVETENAPAVLERIGKLNGKERVERVGPEFLSCSLQPEKAEALAAIPGVYKVHAKKQSLPHVDRMYPAVGLCQAGDSKRLVEETGAGVVIGVVDSGFDLSHPMFRDRENRLRVDGLLDQRGNNKEYFGERLAQAFQDGEIPSDESGHGTHVASIAGGTRHKCYEGIASGARFLLVRTDFRNTDRAVSWIFEQAGDRPCVVNLSYGNHFGSHDGTSAEERLHEEITGAGRIIVTSAGNERERRLHVGGRFHPDLTQRVRFDVQRQESVDPFVFVTIWHEAADHFEGSLISPAGEALEFPAIGKKDEYESSRILVTVARAPYAPKDTPVNLVQTQIELRFDSTVRELDLQGWGLEFQCREATIGRLDAWFHNEGFAQFREHPLLEQTRTIGIPACGRGVIAVGSHVSRNSWTGDDGEMADRMAVIGRTSSFSSLGPTRDGRSKPDFSAPGQYITAAAARDSELSRWSERACQPDRTLTIEGTSMAAPVVTGIIALMLQKQPKLTPGRAIEILRSAASHDAHTGFGVWTPAYGYGKVNARAALSAL